MAGKKRQKDGGKAEVPFLEQFESFMRNHRGLAESTLKGYRWDLGYYCEWLKREGLKVDKIGPKDLDRYVKYMREEKELSGKTCKRRIAAISTYYKWMVREELAEKDPVYFIELPKTASRLPVYLNEDEGAKFFEMLDEEAARRPIIGARNKALFLLMVNGGLRISEAVTIREGQITIRDGYPVSMTVIGKGNKEREIPINEECGKALLAWMETKQALRDDDDLARKLTRKGRGVLESGFLFPGARGGSMSPRTVQQKIAEMRKKHFGGKKITPHKLRHTFATWMYQEGGDINTIRELLGHSSLATTQIYTHVDDKQKRATVELLDRRRKGRS